MPISAEHKLDDDDELLLRQVIPIWVQEGRPTSRAFRPNSNDGGYLSSDRNSVTTPREAYEAYLARQRRSAGVWGLTVGELANENLPSYSDPLNDDPAHAVTDFSACAEKEQRNKSKRLQVCALDRGCLYSV